MSCIIAGSDRDEGRRYLHALSFPLFSQMKILLLLSLASTAAAIPAMSTLNEQRKWSTKIQVRLGDAPLSKYIDRSFPSYSIELAYWSEFVGGLNEPNEFTLKVLQKYVLHYCVASCLQLLTFRWLGSQYH